MRNYLKYSSLEFREPEGLCTPQGPSFKWARPVSCCLANSLLQLTLPRHAPDQSFVEQRQPKRDNVLDFPSREEDAETLPDQSWEYHWALGRHFAFYGPWFTGVQGELIIDVCVSEPKKPQSDASYFHPRAFEQTVASYLDSYYGHIEYEGKPQWQAPVNWRPVHTLPVPAARFDLLPSPDEQGNPIHFCMLPINDQRLLSISFTFDQLCTGLLAERDTKIDRQPMWELVENILGSLQLTLSDEAQQQLARVEAECPDMSLIEEFAPLKWPTEKTPAKR